MSWKAPEPSPYFDVKLHARLREAQASEPEGFWSRTRAFLMYSTGHRLRPALAGAMVVGGDAGRRWNVCRILWQHNPRLLCRLRRL